jgi:hypothetical protein
MGQGHTFFLQLTFFFFIQPTLSKLVDDWFQKNCNAKILFAFL